MMEGVKMVRVETKPKTEFTQWVQENNGHGYYIDRFDRLFQDMYFKIYGMQAYVFYREYCIMHFFIENGQLFLNNDVQVNKDNKSVIQKKLIHEYYEYFELYKGCYKVLQINIISIEKYLLKVKDKINAGFKRYSELLQERDLSFENTGYLRIEVDNAFSVQELNSLLEAYNQLYSIISYMWDNGYDEIRYENIETIKESKNMILESIHIGSNGKIVTAGKDFICKLIQVLVSVALEGDRIEYEKKKAQIETEIASSQLFEQRRHEIFSLIKLLDYYTNQKNNQPNNATLSYIEREILIIVERIEQLQGTEHIDYLV